MKEAQGDKITHKSNWTGLVVEKSMKQPIFPKK
jgi:hypothetical protein